MGTVNKSDLIKATAHMTGQPVATVTEIVNVFLTCLTGLAVGGSTVKLTGFGTFQVKARPARLGRNPATGEAIDIPESRKLTFKASKASA